MVSVAPAPHRRRGSDASRVKQGVALAAVLLAVIALWSRGGTLFGKQYEYEEDLVLALDGSATLTINASVPALVTLRGLALDPRTPAIDRDRVRALFDSPVARVANVGRPWRRRGRAFVQVRLRIDDVRRLQEAPPLSWSRYEFTAEGGEHLFRQTVGPSALRPGTLENFGWDGSEIVAFRLHLPSRILEHNSRDIEIDAAAGIRRGNILAWEQHLADRLDGTPLTIEVRMESQSILYRTLWLFAGAFAAAILTLAGLIWCALWRGRNYANNPESLAARSAIRDHSCPS